MSVDERLVYGGSAILALALSGHDDGKHPGKGPHPTLGAASKRGFAGHERIAQRMRIVGRIEGRNTPFLGVGTKQPYDTVYTRLY